MVMVGLVLGVVIAVIVAAQGCGANHPNRSPQQRAAVGVLVR